MSTVGQISNGESGLSARTKLNLVIDRTTVFDTAANFTSNNPTLKTGQLGVETNNLLTVPKFKIGDGANGWNTLPYFNDILISTSERLLGISQLGTLNPADATTYYFGEYPFTANTISGRYTFQFPNNYTITKVLINLYQSVVATNEGVAFYLREASTTDKIITTTLDMSTIGSNVFKTFTYSGLNISVTSGTNYEMKMVCPTWATNPTSVVAVVKFFGY